MRKLPPYFVKADPDCPCEKCDKVRGTCRFCECCYECCECCPTFICPYCHGYNIGAVHEGSDMARELEVCRCEPCVSCGQNVLGDYGNFLEGDYRPICDKCYAKL